MNTIVCPKCHHEFPIGDAFSLELENKIRKEHEDELFILRKKANEADELKAKQSELIADIRHKTIMEMTETQNKEKDALYLQLEDLKRLNAQSIESAKEETTRLLQAEMNKKLEEARLDAIRQFQSDISKLQLQLQMAQETASQQQNNFKEMLEQQREQFEIQKLQQKQFFDNQISQQKEIMERDVAQRERELISKTKLESDLKLKEQDEIIRKLNHQVNAMQETAQSKSQQLQGEALELLIEEKLMRSTMFRSDDFQEVKKGTNGVDVKMIIRNSYGESCGMIMIEAKRAANWSNNWIDKIKTDRIESGAKEAVCLIVSTRLRNEEAIVEDLGDGVWATVPEYFINFIQIMRKSMEEMHRTHKTNIDRNDKKEVLYGYVNSEAFRAKVKAVNEYHEAIYSEGLKIQKGVKKMLDTIIKSREMGDDIFIEIGNRANTILLPGLDSADDIIYENLSEIAIEQQSQSQEIAPLVTAAPYDEYLEPQNTRKITTISTKLFASIFVLTDSNGVYKESRTNKLYTIDSKTDNEVCLIEFA